jgi:hypothetical protein
MNIGGKTGAAPSGPMTEAGAIPAIRRRLGVVPGRRAEDAARLGVARNLAHLLGPIDCPTDPARAAQVSILRNAVASGRYEPDLHEVARKLLIEVAAERVR